MKTNGMPGRFVWRFIAGFVTVLAWAASAAAQTIVVGTGDPDTDVKAVQAAVDQGGEVVLKGHFSFNRPPTVPTATAFVGGLATVLVSKGVAISGAQDEGGEMTSIGGGNDSLLCRSSRSPRHDSGIALYPPEGRRDFCVRR